MRQPYSAPFSAGPAKIAAESGVISAEGREHLLRQTNTIWFISASVTKRTPANLFRSGGDLSLYNILRESSPYYFFPANSHGFMDPGSYDT